MEPPEDKRTPLDEAEGIILRWDSTASEEAREKMIFDSDRNEVDRYLQAVDEIQRSLSSTTINSESSSNSDESGLNSTIRIAMARLEDEFRNILLSHTAPLEPESISFSSDPGSSTHSHRQVDDHEDESEHDQGLVDLLLGLFLCFPISRSLLQDWVWLICCWVCVCASGFVDFGF